MECSVASNVLGVQGICWHYSLLDNCNTDNNKNNFNNNNNSENNHNEWINNNTELMAKTITKRKYLDLDLNNNHKNQSLCGTDDLNQHKGLNKNNNTSDVFPVAEKLICPAKGWSLSRVDFIPGNKTCCKHRISDQSISKISKILYFCYQNSSEISASNSNLIRTIFRSPLMTDISF